MPDLCHVIHQPKKTADNCLVTRHWPTRCQGAMAAKCRNQQLQMAHQLLIGSRTLRRIHASPSQRHLLDLYLQVS